MYKAFCLINSFIFIFLGTMCANVFAQESSIEAKVHSAIQEELQRKTVHSGTLDLYDEKIEKVRNLRMLKEHDSS